MTWSHKFPPLSISNRDGNLFSCGRVGSRRNKHCRYPVCCCATEPSIHSSNRWFMVGTDTLVGGCAQSHLRSRITHCLSILFSSITSLCISTAENKLEIDRPSKKVVNTGHAFERLTTKQLPFLHPLSRTVCTSTCVLNFPSWQALFKTTNDTDKAISS